MTATLVLIITVLANLAWLTNPHACCLKMDDVYGGQGTHYSLNMAAEKTGPDYSINVTAGSDYLRLTLSDQFSKGVNNLIPETNPASAPLLWEKDFTTITDEIAPLVTVDYTSIVVLPAEKPPTS